jgi:RNA polymerase sigma-70 factor (ECF subfamily)
MLLRRKAIDPHTDEELVARLREGHQASLGALWDRYAHLLFGVGLKYLKDGERSKDAVVEVFERLPQLLATHTVNHFRSWVHVVMRNHCLQALRKSGHEVRDELTLERMTEEAGSDNLLHEATLQQLEQAIARLNEPQQRCIRLFYIERLSYAQVQEHTGYNYDQVRSHLQNGRRNLKLMLQRTTDQNS